VRGCKKLAGNMAVNWDRVTKKLPKFFFIVEALHYNSGNKARLVYFYLL
jgi:hypothetical protein